MKKRQVLLLMTTMLIALSGCSKQPENKTASDEKAVASEQSASEEDKGGMSSPDSDDMEASAQKAYDLWASFRGICCGYSNNEIEDRYYEEHENENVWTIDKDCEYNYDALTEEEKQAFDELYPDVKNHYTFYSGDDGLDIYTYLTFELDGTFDELNNLSEDAYFWAFLDSYRIENGKIYGELDSTDKEDGRLYKFEGELAVNEFPPYYTQEWIESHKDNYKNTLDSFIQSNNIQDEIDFEETLENYETYLEEWKTASWIGDDDSTVIIYKIKGYEDGTLIIEDCYREVPSFGEYLKAQYSTN